MFYPHLLKSYTTMVKKERKAKWEDAKFPSWEVVNYWFQTKEYFSIVKKLHNKGLNPKTYLTTIHVCDEDLIEVFGPKCSYKFTNPFIMLIQNVSLKSCIGKFMVQLPQPTMISCYGW